jgi:hypothetical protein
VSPPEADDEYESSSGVASYSNSGYGTNSGYSNSDDYESAHTASGVDFQEYMQDRFSTSFNPIPLDKSMAVQAQS